MPERVTAVRGDALTCRRMRCKQIALWCLLPAFLASGCAWSRARTNIQDFHQRIERVEPGQTKISEVPGILGSPPNNIIPTPDGGSILLYTFGDSRTESFNLLVVNFSRENIGIDSAYERVPSPRAAMLGLGMINLFRRRYSTMR